MTEGKFGFEPGALPRIRTELRIGADDLDKAVTRKSPPVDAGDSSDIVAEAIGRLQTIGAAIAEHLDRSTGKVDLAHGSYAAIENTNKGELQLDKLYPDADLDENPHKTHDGLLIDAPDPGTGRK